jgi:hypothetical protein
MLGDLGPHHKDLTSLRDDLHKSQIVGQQHYLSLLNMSAENESRINNNLSNKDPELLGKIAKKSLIDDYAR